MASLNLSSESGAIQRSYETVLKASLAQGTSRHHCVWAVFSVSAPLVNVFQNSGYAKDSVLKVQSSGEGDFHELSEEFSDGRIQFAFVKLRDPNSNLPKTLLLSWCGDGVPERTKGYFTSFQSAVEKALHGYNLQITCRSDHDLDSEQIFQKVSMASGSRYSVNSELSSPSTNTGTQKAEEQRSRNAPYMPTPQSFGSSAPTKASTDDDGWGPDAPPITRSSLEKVDPAYKPTRIDMPSLMSGASSSVDATVSHKEGKSSAEVVRGGYQPIGKVDIAALRREAGASQGITEDKPFPVKGAYEPIGRVDIAEIRAKAQPADSGRAMTPSGQNNMPTTAEHAPPSRLAALPKPKTSHKFNAHPNFTGTTAPMPLAVGQAGSSSSPLGAGRTFAMSAGKTPAQLWAEKHNKAGPTAPATTPVNTEPNSSSGPSQELQADDNATGASDVAALRASFNQTKISEPQKARPLPIEDMSKDAAAIKTHSEMNIDPQFSKVQDNTDIDTEAETESEPIIAQPVASSIKPPELDASKADRAAIVKDTVPSTSEVPIVDRSDEPSAPVSNSADHFDVAHNEGTKAEAIALYDYTIDEDNELTLTEGERITNIDMIDADWWHGTNSKGETGLFPSNHVQLVEDDVIQKAAPEDHATPAPTDTSATVESAAAPQGRKAEAVALYDYDAAEDNELSFPEGAVITNLEFPDEDWWQGKYGGREGLFPANHVQLTE